MERPTIYVIASRSQFALAFCRSLNTAAGRTVFEAVPIDWRSFMGREGKKTDFWVLRGEAFNDDQTRILSEVLTWKHLSFYDMSRTP